jgi:hydroxylamine dehydrogenase
MRKTVVLCIYFLLVFTVVNSIAVGFSASPTNKCIVCHKKNTPGIFSQWEGSTHAKNDVTCLECHSAEKEDPDAFEHNNTLIATLVSPKDCAMCHDQESEEVSNSYHATAGEILDSNDAYLAHVAGGSPAAMMGCESCHGAVVKLDPSSPNKLSVETWPNSGIGRLNPDGSKGTCTACHMRHGFSKAQARQPEVCSKCHLGPDHPQKEVYEESKHGNTYYTNIHKMNLDSYSWIVGQDYSSAPTCATCHMSATPKQAVTHDVGERISWTLRPIVSKKKVDWEKKRENMLDVCGACHGAVFAGSHYYQFDGLVNLYNEKFAKPANTIITMIREKNLFENPASFSNPIEWTFWEIWHHEGRRARHGAAMMGPDYTWWHGIYEVAKHFYFKFIPEALEYQNSEVNAYIETMLKTDPMHNWLSRPTADLKEEIRSGKIQKVYKKLFKQE